jgi:hypothetical protein
MYLKYLLLQVSVEGQDVHSIELLLFLNALANSFLLAKGIKIISVALFFLKKISGCFVEFHLSV